MMQKMNQIRNIANAFALVYRESNSSDSSFEYHERFRLNWNLYKGETPPSEEAKENFHLYVFLAFGLKKLFNSHSFLGHLHRTKCGALVTNIS